MDAKRGSTLRLRTRMTFKSRGSITVAVSACGGIISFEKQVEVEIKMGATYTVEKFYVMNKLPRTLLTGFPFFIRTGAILDARAGTLSIQDFKQTIPLVQIGKQATNELIFAAFELMSQ